LLIFKKLTIENFLIVTSTS